MTIHAQLTPSATPDTCGASRRARLDHPAGSARFDLVPDQVVASELARQGLALRLESALADLSAAGSRLDPSLVTALTHLDISGGEHLATSVADHLVRCLEELADPEVRPWLLPARADPDGPVQLTLL